MKTQDKNQVGRLKMQRHGRKLLRTTALLIFGVASQWLSARSFVIENSRITFITDNLVRLEYANHQKFLNDPTLFAVIRKDYDVEVEHRQEGNKHFFTTKAMNLEFDHDGFPFGQNNVRASFMMNGKKRGWCITDGQSGNLKGALCTLDGIGGPVEREEGLLSRNGWYLINDTGKDIYKNGRLCYRDRDHVQDLYLFVYGTDYKAALKSLAAISGPVPMTRKYVHGAWYCRWWQYTADDYRELVAGYQRDAAVDQRGHIAQAQNLGALDVKILGQQHQRDAHKAHGDGKRWAENERIAQRLHRALGLEQLHDGLYGEGAVGEEDGLEQVQVGQDETGQNEPGKEDEERNPAGGQPDLFARGICGHVHSPLNRPSDRPAGWKR